MARRGANVGEIRLETGTPRMALLRERCSGNPEPQSTLRVFYVSNSRLPAEVDIRTRLTRGIELNVPIGRHSPASLANVTRERHSRTSFTDVTHERLPGNPRPIMAGVFNDYTLIGHP